jgi:hypothetical protein
MERLNFSIKINAPKEKVWETMLGEKTYPEWTAAFAEGSQVETDWQKGSKAIFGDGKGNGMVSTIAENKPNEYLSIKHLGMIKNGVEDTTSEEVKSWAGAMENYTLKETNGVTEVTIEMDSDPGFKDYFTQTWPKALDKVKEIAEKS